MEKRYFRLHRGSFAESMETVKEVNSLSDIQNILDGGVFPKGYLSNIHIDDSIIKDPRLMNIDWGENTYMVVADFDGYTNQCVGQSNFFALT